MSAKFSLDSSAKTSLVSEMSESAKAVLVSEASPMSANLSGSANLMHVI